VFLWSFNGADNMIWIFQADGTIKNKKSGRVLEIAADGVEARKYLQLA